MGMRGGVSLAVWMGGACSEVDRLRHALDDDAAADPVYRRLLEAGGHTSVAVDVLARGERRRPEQRADELQRRPRDAVRLAHPRPVAPPR